MMKGRRRTWLNALSALMPALVVALAMLAACGESTRTAYSHFEQIGAEGWDPLDILMFEPWPADSSEVLTQRYDLELVARYGGRHEAARLPLAITIEDAGGVLRADTVVIDPEIPIETTPSGLRAETSANKFGVREMHLHLGDAIRLSEGMRVSVSPLCSRENTRGILNVGLVMRRSQH